MKNIIDIIDTMKANSVTEKEFKSVWGISLEEYTKRMMEHVCQTDARIKGERLKKKDE